MESFYQGERLANYWMDCVKRVNPKAIFIDAHKKYVGKIFEELTKTGREKDIRDTIEDTYFYLREEIKNFQTLTDPLEFKKRYNELAYRSAERRRLKKNIQANTFTTIPRPDACDVTELENGIISKDRANKLKPYCVDYVNAGVKEPARYLYQAVIHAANGDPYADDIARYRAYKRPEGNLRDTAQKLLDQSEPVTS